MPILMLEYHLVSGMLSSAVLSLPHPHPLPPVTLTREFHIAGESSVAKCTFFTAVSFAVTGTVDNHFWLRQMLVFVIRQLALVAKQSEAVVETAAVQPEATLPRSLTGLTKLMWAELNKYVNARPKGYQKYVENSNEFHCLVMESYASLLDDDPGVDGGEIEMHLLRWMFNIRFVVVTATTNETSKSIGSARTWTPKLNVIGEKNTAMEPCLFLLFDPHTESFSLVFPRDDCVTPKLPSNLRSCSYFADFAVRLSIERHHLHVDSQDCISKRSLWMMESVSFATTGSCIPEDMDYMIQVRRLGGCPNPGQGVERLWVRMKTFSDFVKKGALKILLRRIRQCCTVQPRGWQTVGNLKIEFFRWHETVHSVAYDFSFGRLMAKVVRVKMNGKEFCLRKITVSEDYIESLFGTEFLLRCKKSRVFLSPPAGDAIVRPTAVVRRVPQTNPRCVFLQHDKPLCIPYSLASALFHLGYRDCANSLAGESSRWLVDGRGGKLPALSIWRRTQSFVTQKMKDVHNILCVCQARKEYNPLDFQPGTEIVAMCELIRAGGNCGHVVSFVDGFIFDPTFPHALVLNQSNLDLVCDGLFMGVRKTRVVAVSRQSARKRARKESRKRRNECRKERRKERKSEGKERKSEEPVSGMHQQPFHQPPLQQHVSDARRQKTVPITVSPHTMVRDPAYTMVKSEKAQSAVDSNHLSPFSTCDVSIPPVGVATHEATEKTAKTRKTLMSSDIFAVGQRVQVSIANGKRWWSADVVDHEKLNLHFYDIEWNSGISNNDEAILVRYDSTKELAWFPRSRVVHDTKRARNRKPVLYMDHV